MAMEKITDPKFFSNNKNLIGKTLFVRHKGFNGTSPETDKRTICFPECYIIVGVNRIMPDQGRPIDYISGELGLHICPQDEYETFGFVSDVCIDYREDIFLKDEYWIKITCSICTKKNRNKIKTCHNCICFWSQIKAPFFYLFF